MAELVVLFLLVGDRVIRLVSLNLHGFYPRVKIQANLTGPWREGLGWLSTSMSVVTGLAEAFSFHQWVVSAPTPMAT